MKYDIWKTTPAQYDRDMTELEELKAGLDKAVDKWRTKEVHDPAYIDGLEECADDIDKLLRRVSDGKA